MKATVLRIRAEPPNLVGAELDRCAVQAEQNMARVRCALRLLDEVVPESPATALLITAAGKAAMGAAAADSTLERLTTVARGGHDPEDLLDLLLAARSAGDALRECADLVDLVVVGLDALKSSEMTK